MAAIAEMLRFVDGVGRNCILASLQNIGVQDDLNDLDLALNACFQGRDFEAMFPLFCYQCSSFSGYIGGAVVLMTDLESTKKQTPKHARESKKDQDMDADTRLRYVEAY